MTTATRRLVRSLGALVAAGAGLAVAAGAARGRAVQVRAAGGGGTASLLARYDFGAAPAGRWKLPRALDEISGLAIDGAGRIFAHDDERAIVYELDPVSQRIVKRFAFGRPAVRGDFEGIALAGDRVILMTSDGDLYVGREGNDGEAVPYTTQATGIGRRCEVEGLAWDEGARSLLIACKTPRIKALSGRLAVFAWPLDQRTPVATPKILVPMPAVVRRLGHGAFSPTELLIDSKTGHLLLLAARPPAIVELTPAGELVGVARLRGALHRQAEGLALERDGTLLVSDEANGARATLTAYRPSR
jgi:uncharacterized protein YjiK